MILNQIIVSTIILLLKYPYLDKELKNQLKALDVSVSFINTPEHVTSLKIGYKGIIVGLIPM